MCCSGKECRGFNSYSGECGIMYLLKFVNMVYSVLVDQGVVTPIIRVQLFATRVKMRS